MPQTRLLVGRLDLGSLCPSPAHVPDRQETAGVQAVIVPSEDPHQSEYAAACFERRQFISRFTVRTRLPSDPRTPRCESVCALL